MYGIRKMLQILDEGGPGRLFDRALGFAYRNAVRQWIPAGQPVHYAKIPTGLDRKWVDKFVPSGWVWHLNDRPDYEEVLVSSLNEQVREGDRVVVVGGGVGVTAVIAALRAGLTGRVDCFEGSSKHAKWIRETARLNKVRNLTVHHAVVGRDIGVYSTWFGRGTVVAPNELLPCDVLELDCEGSEADILRDMSIRPRIVLVETHGLYGAPTTSVETLLRERGYSVLDLGWAEPGSLDFCIQNDVRVLLGTVADH